jgi:thymidylate synthase (FAD)
MGSDDAVVDAARISYGEQPRSSSSNAQLINYLMEHEHTSPFEMCEAKFFIKAPMFVARQWFRHRTANINELSGRYTEVLPECYIPEHRDLKTQSSSNKQCSSDNVINSEDAKDIVYGIQKNFEIAYQNYQAMLSAGVSREMARICLPMNTYTLFYWKNDLHNIFKMMKLRADTNTQSETRRYADIILHRIIPCWVPLCYNAFLEHNLNAKKYSNSQKLAIKHIMGHIRIDEGTYELIKNKFQLKDRQLTEILKSMNINRI